MTNVSKRVAPLATVRVPTALTNAAFPMLTTNAASLATLAGTIYAVAFEAARRQAAREQVLRRMATLN